jgi:hypothetical protein
MTMVRWLAAKVLCNPGPPLVVVLAHALIKHSLQIALHAGGAGAASGDSDEEMQWATPFGVGKFLGMANADEHSTDPNAAMRLQWYMPHARGRQSIDVNGTWNIMCSHPACHATKYTHAGIVYKSCSERCTPWVDEVARGSVVVAKAKINGKFGNGKLSKPTRIELKNKGYLTVDAS